MFRACRPKPLFFIRAISVIALIAVIAPIFAQDPKPARRPRRPRGSGIPSEQITFPNAPKRVKFNFYTLDHTKFNSTLAVIADLPKGFGGKITHPQQVLFMCYGYKKGGNTRIYETPVVPGTTPEQMTRLIADARIFKDVPPNEKWRLKGIIIDGLFVTSTSYFDEVNTAAISALTRKHWLR